MNKQLVFHSEDQLKEHILTRQPTLYHSSQTSTVIPFEKMENLLNKSTVLGNLSLLKGNLSFDSEFNLKVSGFVTWKEAKEFCRQHGREVMTSPTEELAGILSGIATSATGERSFGFKNLRSQIISLDYLNFNAEKIHLESCKELSLGVDLTSYQEEFSLFSNFKNAPFPRMAYETDLMTGTEGQLGVIVGATLKTIRYEPETYMFFLLPKWEEDYRPHLELFYKVQGLRGKIRACELIDANSLSYLSEEKRVGKNQDLVFLEIKKDDFEDIYNDLLSNFEFIHEDSIFEMNSSTIRELRVSIPRAIFEVNTRMGVTKKGTDIQVSSKDIKSLLDKYRELSKLKVDYNLFGHFGDAHLHFNFMPTPNQNEFCINQLDELYKVIKAWGGSPFAEHGIGLLKKKFITDFYSDNQRRVFKKLKNDFDPFGQFFIEGFMSC